MGVRSAGRDARGCVRLRRGCDCLAQREQRAALRIRLGRKRANAFGLHDMLGNVREWVHDFYWYMERLPGGAVTDPTGASAGMYRVIRGGCYYDSTASLCGASFRNHHYPRDDRGGQSRFPPCEGRVTLCFITFLPMGTDSDFGTSFDLVCR